MRRHISYLVLVLMQEGLIQVMKALTPCRDWAGMHAKLLRVSLLVHPPNQG